MPEKMRIQFKDVATTESAIGGDFESSQCEVAAPAPGIAVESASLNDDLESSYDGSTDGDGRSGRSECVKHYFPPYDPESLSSEGVAVTPDGGVFKIQIKGGIGRVVKTGDTVDFRYKNYLADVDEPFDVSFRMKSKRVRVGPVDDEEFQQLLPGFDIALRSMRKGEKAIFVIRPEYAYGRAGAYPHVLPDATIITEIQLVNLISEEKEAPDQDKAGTEPGLCQTTEGNESSFKNRLGKAKKLGRECLIAAKEERFGGAMDSFKKAQKIMENLSTHNDEEAEQWSDVMLDMYMYGTFAALKAGDPALCCSLCQEANNVCSVEDFKFAKIYYRWAKAKFLLGKNDARTLKFALSRLKLAERLVFGKSVEKTKAIKAFQKEITDQLNSVLEGDAETVPDE